MSFDNTQRKPNQIRPKKILLLPNEIKDRDLEVTRALADRLIVDGAEIMLSDRFGDVPFLCIRGEESLLMKECDMAVTLGGDGTLLAASLEALKYDLPLLGINLGRVGFLAELEKNELDEISRLFTGDFRIEERARIDITIEKSTGEVFTSTVLNDCCVSAKSNSRVVEFDLYSQETDGDPELWEKVSHYRADGVIFSTPTGSTAYSLSAGGVPCDPRMSAICMTPICSHSLTNATTLIFSDSRRLAVKNLDGRDALCFAALDGSDAMRNGENIILTDKDTLYVSVSRKKTKLVRLMDRSFYNILFNKFK